MLRSVPEPEVKGAVTLTTGESLPNEAVTLTEIGVNTTTGEGLAEGEADAEGEGEEEGDGEGGLTTPKPHMWVSPAVTPVHWL